MIDVPDIQHQQRERSRLQAFGRRTDSWAVRITDNDPGAVDPEADAADDALIPGRWGIHISQQIRRPNATAAEYECDVRYCPACVQEADRWSADTE